MNHRIFERTLRPLVFRGVHPFECREQPSTFSVYRPGKAWTLEVFVAGLVRSQLLLNELVGSVVPILDVISTLLRLGVGLEPCFQIVFE